MKRSITKRFTREAHREVLLGNVARPRRVKAYRAVRSCLVGGGVSGHPAKGRAPGRSWLNTIGCVCCIRSRRAHNRPVKAAPVRSLDPVSHGAFGQPWEGAGPSWRGWGRGPTGPHYRPMCRETQGPGVVGGWTGGGARSVAHTGPGAGRRARPGRGRGEGEAESLLGVRGRGRRGQRRPGAGLADGCAGRSPAATENRTTDGVRPSEARVRHNRHCHPGLARACSLQRRARFCGGLGGGGVTPYPWGYGVGKMIPGQSFTTS